MQQLHIAQKYQTAEALLSFCRHVHKRWLPPRLSIAAAAALATQAVDYCSPPPKYATTSRVCSESNKREVRLLLLLHRAQASLLHWDDVHVLACILHISYARTREKTASIRVCVCASTSVKISVCGDCCWCLSPSNRYTLPALLPQRRLIPLLLSLGAATDGGDAVRKAKGSGEKWFLGSVCFPEVSRGCWNPVVSAAAEQEAGKQN